MNGSYLQHIIENASVLNWIAISGIVLIAALGSWGMARWAYRGGMLDLPNARSSHRLPTPRGGGLAVVVAFMLGLGWLQFTISLDAALLNALLYGGGGLACIGLLDDYYSLRRSWRLLGQFLAAAWALYCLQGVDLVSNLSPLLWWGEQLILLIALVWLINLYNFMDGIDGLAASEAIFVALAFILLTATTHDISRVMAILAAASVGFLFLNWAPARIFMGDSGSCFLGYVLGVCLLAGAEQQLLSVWAALILLAVFIVDATYTLLHRVIRRTRWYEPHCSHAYQRAARRCNSHAVVTLVVLMLNIGWLLPCAWMASRLPQWGGVIAVLAILPLLGLVRRLGAGHETGATY